MMVLFRLSPRRCGGQGHCRARRYVSLLLCSRFLFLMAGPRSLRTCRFVVATTMVTAEFAREIQARQAELNSTGNQIGQNAQETLQ
jgi:hypothetical protein